MIMKLYRSLKFFFVYRNEIKLNMPFLIEKYGMNLDKFYRIWTVIDLSVIPEEITKQYGKGVLQMEYEKYMKNFNHDLIRLNMNELVARYELKNLGNNKLGVTFGYSQFRSEYYYLSIWLLASSIILISIFLGILIF